MIPEIQPEWDAALHIGGVHIELVEYAIAPLADRDVAQLAYFAGFGRWVGVRSIEQMMRTPLSNMAGTVIFNDEDGLPVSQMPVFRQGGLSGKMATKADRISLTESYLSCWLPAQEPDKDQQNPQERNVLLFVRGDVSLLSLRLSHHLEQCGILTNKAWASQLWQVFEQEERITPMLCSEGLAGVTIRMPAHIDVQRQAVAQAIRRWQN